MKIVSLFTGMPKEIDGEFSSISKSRVEKIIVKQNSVLNDQVHNTQHHGGINRVLHVFPSENIQHIKDFFPTLKINIGDLGENISTQNMLDHTVCIGDIYQISSVKVQVTEPRKPCWMIDHHLKQNGLAKFIQEECITGWFFKIIGPGEIKSNMDFKLIKRQYPDLTIQNCVNALLNVPNNDILRQMMNNPILSDNWKNPSYRLHSTGVLEDQTPRLKRK